MFRIRHARMPVRIESESGSGALANGNAGALSIVMSGDLSADAACDLLFRAAEASLRHGAEPLTLDLHAVASADTKLVACIVRLSVLARRQGTALQVRASGPVLSVLGLCRLDFLARSA